MPYRPPEPPLTRPQAAGTRTACRRSAVSRQATEWVLGLALGALALGPGLGRGFLLSYDMVVVPREPFTAAMSGLSGGPPRAVPSDAVLAVAALVLPADVVQKLVLLLIFALACAGVAALLDREPWLARLAAGVAYAWNPFVAERLIIGQWALLLGYAGLPWVLRAVRTKIHRTRASPLASWPGAGRLGLALLPAMAGGFAAISISALVAVPAAALARRRWLDVAVAVGVLLAGSLPWLIPALLRPVTADPAGIGAFAARADTPFGSLGSLVMLGGIWNAQVVPAAYGGAWSALWLAAVLLALAGYLLLGGVARWPGLGVAALAGLVIASIGITAPGRALLRAATQLWPGFSIVRDGQQFVAPLALAEALGFGLAVAWAMRPRPRRARPDAAPSSRPGTNLSTCPDAVLSPTAVSPQAPLPPVRPDRLGWLIGVAAVCLPVLLLPGLAWGAAGRLRPVQYPAELLSAARMINQSRAPGDALLLPWAAYRRPAWNHGEPVLDPWPRLLRRPVIWNDGSRVGGIQLTPDDPRARHLDRVIQSPGPLSRRLAAAGVRFVIIDSGTLDRARLPGCRVVADTLRTGRSGLAVCQLPDPAGRAP